MTFKVPTVFSFALSLKNSYLVPFFSSEIEKFVEPIKVYSPYQHSILVIILS